MTQDRIFKLVGKKYKYNYNNTKHDNYILDRLYTYGLLVGFKGFGESMLIDILKNFESRELYENCSVIKRHMIKIDKNEKRIL